MDSEYEKKRNRVMNRYYRQEIDIDKMAELLDKLEASHEREKEQRRKRINNKKKEKRDE